LVIMDGVLGAGKDFPDRFGSSFNLLHKRWW
jgi:hypothetical protein